MRPRPLAFSLALALPALVLSPEAPLEGPPRAEASVSLLLSLRELVSAASFVVVGTPLERYSVWEEVAGGRRIVTYTRVKIEESVVGSAGGSEVLVRTLGGKVGRIGQHVSGEASISPNKRALLFLSKVDDAILVTGLAQGHFPIVHDTKDKSERLGPSPDTGTLLPRRGPVISAREELLGARLSTALDSVRRMRAVLDASK